MAGYSNLPGVGEALAVENQQIRFCPQLFPGFHDHRPLTEGQESGNIREFNGGTGDGDFQDLKPGIFQDDYGSGSFRGILFKRNVYTTRNKFIVGKRTGLKLSFKLLLNLLSFGLINIPGMNRLFIQSEEPPMIGTGIPQPRIV